jgi:hypothetical protein
MPSGGLPFLGLVKAFLGIFRVIRERYYDLADLTTSLVSLTERALSRYGLGDVRPEYRDVFRAARILVMVSWILSWPQPSDRSWGPGYLQQAAEWLTRLMRG